MPRDSRNFAVVITLLSFLSMSAINCAGTSQSSSKSGDSASLPPSEKAQAEAQQDPKVEEAKTRCESEIKKSELQPGDALVPIQVHACLYAIKPDVAACTSGPKREVVIKIIVEKTGVVSNAFPVGDTADSSDAKCVAEAVKKATFPKFKGSAQQMLKYPFTLGE